MTELRVTFLLGLLCGMVMLYALGFWEEVAEAARRSGWTPAELRRPIAWDGPWTDGFRWREVVPGYSVPEGVMKWRSPTGRELRSMANRLEDFDNVPPWSCYLH